MEAGQVEDAIGAEQGDGVGQGGVDAEDLAELEDLLGDDGGGALHHLCWVIIYEYKLCFLKGRVLYWVS